MRCLPVDSVDVVARTFGYTDIDVTAYKKHFFGDGWVHKSVKAPGSVYIGRGSLVMESVSFNGSVIGIGEGVRIGSRTSIGENVLISSNAKIGSKVVIGNDSRIGCKTSVQGNVRIGEVCDIRSFCNIGKRCKLDNHIQIDENTCISSCSVIDSYVFIGSNTLIGYHSALREASEIGKNVLLPVNSVIGKKVRIKDGVRIPFAVTINNTHDICYYVIGDYGFTFLRNGMCYCLCRYDRTAHKFNTLTDNPDFTKQFRDLFRYPNDVKRYFVCLEKAKQFFSKHKRATK